MTVSVIEHAQDEHKCDSCPCAADATIQAGGKTIWTCGPCLDKMWEQMEDISVGVVIRENKRERDNAVR